MIQNLISQTNWAHLHSRGSNAESAMDSVQMGVPKCHPMVETWNKLTTAILILFTKPHVAKFIDVLKIADLEKLKTSV